MAIVNLVPISSTHVSANYQLSSSGNPLYMNVDEIIADDTDYNYRSGATDTFIVGTEDYLFEALNGASSIIGITVYIRTSSDFANSNWWYVQFGASTLTFPTAVFDSGFGMYFCPDTWTTYASNKLLKNPTTTLDWTISDLNALHIKPSLFSGDRPARQSRMSQLYVEVDYVAGGVNTNGNFSMFF